MKNKGIVLALVLALSPVLTLAQMRGGGGRRGGQGGPSQGQQPRKGGPGMGRGTMDRDRLRSHATDQQRDQYRTCTQSADRVRAQARQMAQATGKGFNADQARQQREQLHNRIQTMQQEHERLLEGLNNEQRAAMQEHIRNMEEIHERVRTRMQEMDQELAQTNPDGKRVAERARAIEREMKQWQKHHREMGQDLSLQP